MWARLSQLPAFIKFAIIGTIGFIVDSGVLELCIRVLGLDHYTGRVLSVFVAMTVTWLGNRSFTFVGHVPEPWWRQAAKFYAANALGALINYGVYSAMVASSATIHDHPIWGVAAGAIVAMVFNYFVASKLIFKRHGAS